jgi:hypothetical protein
MAARGRACTAGDRAALLRPSAPRLAKCCERPLVERFAGDRQTVRSADVNQLMAYLANASTPGTRLEGVLLYAVDRPTIRPTRVRVLGKAVRIQELDLDQPWYGIDRALRDFVADLIDAAPLASTAS